MPMPAREPNKKARRASERDARDNTVGGGARRCWEGVGGLEVES